MTLTDQQVLDAVNGLLDREHVPPSDRTRWLHAHRHNTSSLQGMLPLIDRYLKIMNPPRTCQVTHDHWEGPMICGNTLPCPRHGGG